MKTISFLASDGENILWDRLSQLFEGASVLRIASAFLAAEDKVVEWVAKDPNRRVEIVVRLKYPTNPESVAKLRGHPNVAILAAAPQESSFHEKLFLAVDSAGNPIGAYIGSANWTHGGLTKNREAGVWISEQELLRQMADHFAAGFRSARKISDQMLAELRAESLRQESHEPPEKDLGTFISSWGELKARSDGRFLIKQGGIGQDPFVEGRDEIRKFMGDPINHSAQTFNGIPETITPGLGIIVCRIAKRQNNSRDRVITGRGRIAGIDRKLWRLPEAYLKDVGKRFGPEKVKYLKRWPDILWLDAEFIDYPQGCNELLWLTDYMDQSFREGFRHFQAGYRWMSADMWKACNQAIDEHTRKFRVLPLNRDGVWWNHYLGIIDPADPLFMTKARIEKMNLSR